MNSLQYLKSLCKRCCDKNKLQDLSFTGEQFNNHNLETIIKKLPINHTYITDDYKIDNYIINNITVKVRKKIE